MIAGVVAASNAWLKAVADYPSLADYSSASFNTAATSHAIPLGTYSPGDLVVIYFATRSDNTTAPALPPGWLGFTSYANTTPTPDGRKGYIYRVMDGAEGASVTLSFADSRVMTYNRMRFFADSFDADLDYLLRGAVNSGRGATSAPATQTQIIFFSKATALRGLSLFGLADVSAYPHPSGEQTSAAGTGIAASSAKSFANIGQDITPPLGSYTWPSWTMSASSDFHEFSLLLRGSKSLGHVDPRYLSAWSFSTADTTFSLSGISNNLKVGDMLIACSQAESGALNSISLGAAFTQFYSSGTSQYFYRIVTLSDIGANLVPTYSATGNHCGQIFRVRAGSFDAGAVPTVAASSASTSSAPSVSGVTLAAEYASRRNLCLFFEGQTFTSTQSVMTTTANYPLGKIGTNAGATDATSCGSSYGYFDGQTTPAESATLSASATWRAAIIILKGLPIPA